MDIPLLLELRAIFVWHPGSRNRVTQCDITKDTVGPLMWILSMAPELEVAIFGAISLPVPKDPEEFKALITKPCYFYGL